jgi:hypothetical protein
MLRKVQDEQILQAEETGDLVRIVPIRIINTPEGDFETTGRTSASCFVETSMKRQRPVSGTRSRLKMG